jgi:hypothetical protein
LTGWFDNVHLTEGRKVNALQDSKADCKKNDCQKERDSEVAGPENRQQEKLDGQVDNPPSQSSGQAEDKSDGEKNQKDERTERLALYNEQYPVGLDRQLDAEQNQKDQEKPDDAPRLFCGSGPEKSRIQGQDE